MHSVEKHQSEIQRPKHHQCGKILTTIAAISGYFAGAVGISMLGPTLVDMEVLLGVDTPTISWAIMGRSLGNMCGTAVAGFVFPRVNDVALFSSLFLMFGLSTAICPLTKEFIFFAMMLAVQGLGFGVFDGAGQAYMLNKWTGHRLNASIFQSLYVLWAIGTVIGPLMVTPFLSDVEQDIWHNDSNSATNSSENGTDSTNVVHAFVVAGSAVIIPISLFLLSLTVDCSREKRCSRSTTTKRGGKSLVRTDERIKKYETIFKALAAMILFSYAFNFTSVSCFLATYCVKGLGWSTKQASLITSTYFMANLVVKILAIFLYAWLSPRSILYISSTTALFGYGLFPASRLHIAIPWLATALAGCGDGIVQSATFVWSKQHVGMTARTSSIYMTCFSLACVVSPLSIGFLFDQMGPDCVPYVFLVGGVCLFFSFITVDIFVRNFLRRVKHEVHGKHGDRETAADYLCDGTLPEIVVDSEETVDKKLMNVDSQELTHSKN